MSLPWRRVKFVILPVILLGTGVAVPAAGIFQSIAAHYQEQAYMEVANLVGAVAEQAPDFDSAELVRQLKSPDSAQVAAGKALLESYGYESKTPNVSTQTLINSTTVGLIGAILLLTLAVCGYLLFYEYRRECKLRRLSLYLQKLNDDIYDLHLDENDESELSQLSNELYKIVVTLRASAQQNYKIRQSLETSLADISHQLRTPLTSLQIAVDNLSTDANMSPATRREFLRIMAQQVEAMSDLVTTLLHLAKFDSGTIQLRPQPTQLRQIIDRAVDKLAALADLQDVQIEIAGDSQVKCELDARWQSEAIANIVKNCLEHSPAGSKVNISVHNYPLFARITIRDQGEGISKHDLRHIFERFYRAENSAPNSVGIGLAFARTIITAEHGQISVKSTKGEGTTFIITYFK